MDQSLSHRPRISRETRLLLTTAFLAVAVLWGLARVRFPDRPASPNPDPPLLTPLPSLMPGKRRRIAITEEIVDDVTELYNARYLLSAIDREVGRAERQSGELSVVFLDLDYFKRIHDKYGHAAGDEVLRHFAALMRREVRQIDTASRVGGEEFAVILPGATQTSALEFAERLRRKVADSPSEYNGKRVEVTVSIGVTTSPRRCDSTDACIVVIYGAELGRMAGDLWERDYGAAAAPADSPIAYRDQKRRGAIVR